MKARSYPLWLLAGIGVVLSIALLGKMAPAPLYPAHPMQGQPFPFLESRTLAGDAFDFNTLKGKPFIVNVFASWCPGCKAEHPHLAPLKQQANLPLIGIAWKDKPVNISLFLAHKGNPYDAVVVDDSGRLALALGLTGVPETLRVDENGIITHIYKGAVNAKVIEHYLLKAPSP